MIHNRCRQMTSLSWDNAENKRLYPSLLVHFGSTSEYWMKCFRLLTSGYSCISIKEEISLLKLHSKLPTNSINNFYFFALPHQNSRITRILKNNIALSKRYGITCWKPFHLQALLKDQDTSAKWWHKNLTEFLIHKIIIIIIK